MNALVFYHFLSLLRQFGYRLVPGCSAVQRNETEETQRSGSVKLISQKQISRFRYAALEMTLLLLIPNKKPRTFYSPGFFPLKNIDLGLSI